MITFNRKREREKDKVLSDSLWILMIFKMFMVLIPLEIVVDDYLHEDNDDEQEARKTIKLNFR